MRKNENENGEENMSLLKTVCDYCEQDENAERAAFEAAMIDRIQNEGYKVSDLMFEVYQCQKDIEILKNTLRSKSQEKSEKKAK